MRWQMSRFGDEEKWNKLVNLWGLSHSEQEEVHRHLGRNYNLEKDDMTYRQLEEAASEVIDRIVPGTRG